MVCTFKTSLTPLFIKVPATSQKSERWWICVLGKSDTLSWFRATQSSDNLIFVSCEKIMLGLGKVYWSVPGDKQWRPPSTYNSCPVTNEASSDNKNFITLATSIGAAAPPSGWSCRCFSRYCNNNQFYYYWNIYIILVSIILTPIKTSNMYLF